MTIFLSRKFIGPFGPKRVVTARFVGIRGRKLNRNTSMMRENAQDRKAWNLVQFPSIYLYFPSSIFCSCIPSFVSYHTLGIANLVQKHHNYKHVKVDWLSYCTRLLKLFPLFIFGLCFIVLSELFIFCSGTYSKESWDVACVKNMFMFIHFWTKNKSN